MLIFFPRIVWHRFCPCIFVKPNDPQNYYFFVCGSFQNLSTMRTHRFAPSFAFLISATLVLTLLSCGTYQGASYYDSDGIYGGSARVKAENNGVAPSASAGRYQEYFDNMADDYTVLDNTEGNTFTDTENYSSGRSVDSNPTTQAYNQAPWGAQTTRSEVYYINNNPWGYFNFNWGFYNAFYDSYWGYNPFFFRGFYRPYWGLSFYDPYYRFGYGYYGYPYYHTGSYYHRSYYGNRYDQSYARSSYSRGARSYTNNYTSRGSRTTQNNRNTTARGNSSYTPQSKSSTQSPQNRYNVSRRTQNSLRNNTAGSSGRSQTSINRSTTNNNTRSYNNTRSTNNYNNSRSSSPSRSSYSGSSRSSSNYSSGSRGYSGGGGRSSSRGR